MRDDIRFLQELEADLETVSRRRTEGSQRADRRRTLGRGIWAGAAAAVLVVSFALGSVVQNAPDRVAASGGATSGAPVPGAASVPATRGASHQNLEALPGIAAPTTDSQVGYSVSGSGRSWTATRSTSTTDASTVNATEQQGTSDNPADLSKIIKDGEIAVTIDSGTFRDKSTQVVSIAHANGGSVLSSTTANGTSGSFTLRIPAARFDKAMLQLGALGSIDSSTVHGQDVTAQYIDQKAHLKIYLTHRAFLYGLMAKATTTGQALMLENQLQQVQLKIDQITGQLRYLNNQVAESTIKVDLHEPGAEPVASTTSQIENPSLGDAFSRAVQGFLNVIAVTLIGLGYLIPVLVIAAIAWLIVRLAQRRRVREPA